jgi:hypothetical protein
MTQSWQQLYDLLTDEYIGRFDVSMKLTLCVTISLRRRIKLTDDAQGGHVNKCVDNLLEKSPGFIFRDTFGDSLTNNMKTSCRVRSLARTTHLLQRLSFNKFLQTSRL